MFEKGEYVIYGSEGVCRIEDAGVPGINGLDKKKTYYRLSSHYRRGSTIYTPTDTKILMRKVVTKDYADSLLRDIGSVECDLNVPKDQKLATQFYSELVRSYDCKKLMSVIKYVFYKQRELAASKKNLPAVDVKFSKSAEEMICMELAFVLGKDPMDVKQEINDALLALAAKAVAAV